MNLASRTWFSSETSESASSVMHGSCAQMWSMKACCIILQRVAELPFDVYDSLSGLSPQWLTLQLPVLQEQVHRVLGDLEVKTQETKASTDAVAADGSDMYGFPLHAMKLLR